MLTSNPRDDIRGGGTLLLLFKSAENPSDATGLRRRTYLLTLCQSCINFDVTSSGYTRTLVAESRLIHTGKFPAALRRLCDPCSVDSAKPGVIVEIIRQACLICAQLHARQRCSIAAWTSHALVVLNRRTWWNDYSATRRCAQSDYDVISQCAPAARWRHVTWRQCSSEWSEDGPQLSMYSAVHESRRLMPTMQLACSSPASSLRHFTQDECPSSYRSRPGTA